MKRILTLFLCVLMLLPMAVSCSTSLEEEETKTQVKTGEEIEQQETTEETEEAVDYPAIPEDNRLSWEKINSFKIANDSMSEDELRNLCVEFFRFSQTFAWTPKESWSYTIGSSTTKHTMAQGTIYGGFPYLHGAGNVYRIMEFYEAETGVVDITEAGKNQRHFGNFCSYGSGWGFSRVINSAAHKLTQDMVPKNGYIPLGTYKMNMDLEVLPENETVKICSDNGTEVMYESYACLKPGDALVYYTTGGHIIMCSSVHVEKDSSGKVDGEKSYITFLDQDTGWEQHDLADGTSYQVQGGVDEKATFASLFKTSYIPYTFAEFLGTDPVEAGSVTIDLEKTEVTLEELIGATVTANYMFSDVFIDFIDKDGKTAETKTIRTGYGGIMSIELSDGIFAASTKKYATGEYSIKITCRIGNGELLDAWEGKLLAS